MRAVARIGLLLLASATVCLAEGGDDVYRALGLKPKQVLAGTILNSRVTPGRGKQVVCVATHFTGKKGKSEAVNIKLGVFNRAGDSLTPIYQRDFGAERGADLDRGNLELLDLDGDGINEIIVTFDSYEDPLIDQNLAEVILYDESGFRTAWSGPMYYDATKAARNVPRERRDRFQREIDLAGTLKTRGVTLFLKKKVIAIAGERLAEPKIVQETFPLRPAPEHW
jgi:hypothetical protein